MNIQRTMWCFQANKRQVYHKDRRITGSALQAFVKPGQIDPKDEEKRLPRDATPSASAIASRAWNEVYAPAPTGV